jgi:hypothetical protein
MAELSRGQILKYPEVVGGVAGAGGTVQLDDGSGNKSINLKAPDDIRIGTGYTLTLPEELGTVGQVLSIEASGVTTFTTVSAAPGGSDTQIQYNDGGATLAGMAATTDGTHLYISDGNEIRFEDGNGGEYVALGASTNLAQNIKINLPSSIGNAGDALILQPPVSATEADTAWGIPPSGTTQNPGGAGNGEVQYNVGGTFTGEAAFAYDQVSNTLSVEQINSTGIITTGLLDVDSLRLDGNTISNTASTEINLDATFIDILNNTSLRFYNATGTNYGAIKFDNPSADYTITLPATVGAANEVLQFDGTGAASFVSNTKTLNFIIDGDGADITTGIKGHVVIDADYTVTGWTVIANASGSIVVDVNRATFTNFPTTASIAGTELPTLSAAQKAEDLTLTTWTTTLSARDILEFEVDSASGVSLVTVALRLVHR